jgi:ribosome biogenesis protein ERB1
MSLKKSKEIMPSEDEESEEVEEVEEIEDSDEDSEDSDNEFEDQGSSDDDESLHEEEDDEEEDSEEDELIKKVEVSSREWNTGQSRYRNLRDNQSTSSGKLEHQLHIDDLSSDDEDGEGANTIGRVPLHWYDAYDHIGYNISGEKILKPKGKDSIDHAIENKDDPKAAAHTVYDMYNGRYVTLSERDLEIIRRVQTGAFAHPEHNDTPDYVDYYSSIIEEMPIRAAPEPKRRFITSKWETMKVMKILKAMKEGRYVFSDEKVQKHKSQESSVYQIWNDTEDDILSDSNKRNQYHLPAPKVPLPGHAESYNPPSEYLLSSNEIEQMNELPPEEREYNFIPTKFSCLRHVKGYDNFIKERFERCLDLYLCPRKLKRRLNINPETLVPKLPKPRELKPFPNALSLQFLGHTKNVRSITISPDGQYLVSGSDDGTVRLWEVDTSLCRNSWKFPDPVIHVTWNPNPQHHLVAVVTGNKVVLIATGTGDKDSQDILDSFLSVVESHGEGEDEDDENKEEEEEKDSESENEKSDDEKSKKGSIPASKKDRAKLKWEAISPATETDTNNNSKKRNQSKDFKIGPRAQIVFPLPTSFVVWHYRGDYVGVLSPLAATHAISIHQVRNLFSLVLFLTFSLSSLSPHRSPKGPLNIHSVVNHLALWKQFNSILLVHIYL